jgi:hypothetical protein
MTSAARLASLRRLSRIFLCTSLIGGKLQFPTREDPLARDFQSVVLAGRTDMTLARETSAPHPCRQEHPAGRQRELQCALVSDAVADWVDVRLVAVSQWR